jgi:hypothetical protein
VSNGGKFKLYTVSNGLPTSFNAYSAQVFIWTNMMVFNKRKRKSEENEWEWEWEGRKIEWVTEFKYLSFRKANKAVGCLWGIGKRKRGGDFRRRMMMFESMVESILIYGAEIWGLKEQEESESGKESGKVWGQNGWRRVQDNDGMLERKEKEHGEGEREILPEERLCQWRSGKIESKRKMDERRPEWKGQRHRQARKKRENQRIQIQQGVWEVYGRGNSGVPGERESAQERKMMARFRCGNEERENRYWMEREERRRRMCYEGREIIKHIWNGCNEMREGGKGARSQMNEDRKEIRWMKEVWKRRERTEKERGGDKEKNGVFFLLLLFYV